MSVTVLMMDHNNNNNNSTNETKSSFHDFFGPPVIVVPKNACFGGESRQSEVSLASVGASSGGNGPISATSDLGSERQVGHHFEGVPFYGPKSDFFGPDISSRFSGRKRCNSDSAFICSTRDMKPQIGQDSLENSHHMKILHNGAGGKRLRRSHDVEFLGMQPLMKNSILGILLPHNGSKPDSVVSKWERSMPMKVGPLVQYPPRPGQIAHFMDKVSLNRYRDTNAGPSLISQPAADEGSRTGIKGSGILSAINSNSGAPGKQSCVLPSSSSRHAKYGPQVSDPQSSNPPSRHGLTSASRQMTIFYAGQAHVFDDVHPNEADVIMLSAGSNGGSWSTIYSPKSSARPPPSESYMPNGENRRGIENSAFLQELCGRLSVPGNSSLGYSQGA